MTCLVKRIFFLVIRLRLKCCCRCAALTCWHIWHPLPPPSLLSHHTTFFHDVARLVSPPPPSLPRKHPPQWARYQSIKPDSLTACEPVKQKLTVWRRIIRPGFRLPQIASAYRSRLTVVWNEPWWKWTACFQVSVYSQPISRGFSMLWRVSFRTKTESTPSSHHPNSAVGFDFPL